MHAKATIEAHLQTWLNEGHSIDDVIAQARHNWPELSVQDVKDLMQLTESPASNANSHSVSFLKTIQQKRMKEIERLELRLDDEKSSLSVHTLYRGLLRDAETQCFKIMAFERQLGLDREKREANERKQQYQADLAEGRQFEKMFQRSGHAKPYGNGSDDEQESPRSNDNSKSFASFSCLLGIILAWFLAGCSCLRSPLHAFSTPVTGVSEQRCEVRREASSPAKPANGLSSPCIRAAFTIQSRQVDHPESFTRKWLT